MRRSATILQALLCIFLSTIGERGAIAAVPQPVILISIDGFRADYFNRGLTPILAQMAAKGVRATFMRPSFPSLTFPNHYTLVTGLYPDHHGIVDNNMEDPAINPSRFGLSDRSSLVNRACWDQATPLWVSVQRQGGHSATLFWPGSEADIQGVRPDRWMKFDSKMTYDERVDQVLAWLDLPVGQRPQFITLYFDHVDSEGHHEGPDSQAVNDALVEVDAAVGRLQKGISARDMADKINLIVVADHGMSALSPERVFFIDDVISLDDVTLIGGSALMGITIKSGAKAKVEPKLQALQKPVMCRRKEDMPERLHYGHNPRIPPILCLAEPGWVVTTHEAAAKNRTPYRGTHGFDNQSPDMAALFVASGPSFRKGLVHAPFNNVDVYPLIAQILGIKPEPNDGRLDDVRDMLIGQ